MPSAPMMESAAIVVMDVEIDLHPANCLHFKGCHRNRAAHLASELPRRELSQPGLLSCLKGCWLGVPRIDGHIC